MLSPSGLKFCSTLDTNPHPSKFNRKFLPVKIKKKNKRGSLTGFPDGVLFYGFCGPVARFTHLSLSSLVCWLKDTEMSWKRQFRPFTGSER